MASGHGEAWRAIRARFVDLGELPIEQVGRRQGWVELTQSHPIQVFPSRRRFTSAPSDRTGAGSTARKRHDFHYNFMAKNPYFGFRSVNFGRVKRIYDWCNEVVHGVYQPLAWQIDFAHSICGGIESNSDAPGAAWSINNCVEISNLSEMQSAFMKHFSDSYDHGVWAVEALEPEGEIK